MDEIESRWEIPSVVLTEQVPKPDPYQIPQHPGRICKDIDLGVWMVSPNNRRFQDLQTFLLCQKQKLDVVSKSIDGHFRENRLGVFSPDAFEPALGVLETTQNYYLHQQVEYFTHAFADPGLIHLDIGIRQGPRPDGNIIAAFQSLGQF